jgi:molybdate/tungstate transport system substrate-binding protein
MPDKILWYVDIFKSSMVIAYNDASSFSKEINKNNWPQILLDKNVKTGITQPQTEPAGYRALLVFKLLDKLYKNEFDKNEFDKKEYDKNTPDKNMSDKNTPDIKYQGLYNAFMNKFTKDDYRHDVSALVSALEAGFFDYIFIYKSMAVQHRLKYLDLPEKADLSSPEHADFYASEKITLKTLKTDISLTGSPIIYGASIPENASNPDDAARFLAYLIKNKNLLMQRAQLSVNTNRITDPESGLKPDLKPGLKPALKPGLKPALKSSRTYRIFKDCLLPAKEESKIFPAPEQ